VRLEDSKARGEFGSFQRRTPPQGGRDRAPEPLPGWDQGDDRAAASIFIVRRRRRTSPSPRPCA
jgi:hypothetical protein